MLIVFLRRFVVQVWDISKGGVAVARFLYTLCNFIWKKLLKVLRNLSLFFVSLLVLLYSSTLLQTPIPEIKRKKFAFHNKAQERLLCLDATPYRSELVGVGGTASVAYCAETWPYWCCLLDRYCLTCYSIWLRHAGSEVALRGITEGAFYGGPLNTC